jgi:hypothetical protein
MFMSRKVEGAGLGFAVAGAAVILIVYALRFGYFPVDWTPRATKPIRFWVETIGSAAVGLAALAWAILTSTGNLH